jgi:rhamnogalacturonyl hydrolase YesR
MKRFAIILILCSCTIISYFWPVRSNIAGIAAEAVFSAVATAEQYPMDVFRPAKIWEDNNGRPINAHGGGIVCHQGVYYWFGEHKGERSSAAYVGVTCYSSTDLYRWTYEGVALTVEKEPESDIAEGCVMERPKVIYNVKTKKFVMYFHLEPKGQGYAAARVGIAVSDRVTGPYRYLKSLRPNRGVFPQNMTDEQRKATAAPEDFDEHGTKDWKQAVVDGMYVRRDLDGGQMSRDMTLFTDDDLSAYHVYASEENRTLHVARLSDDYTDYTGEYVRVAPGGHNEAPTVFKKDGKYFMITSGCTGWEPNAARLFSADSLMGVWTEHPNPCVGTGADRTFDSQGTFVLPLRGRKDAFIFMADRWTPRRPIDGRYVWLPIAFENGLPVLKWYDEWDLSLFPPHGWAANGVNTVIFRCNSVVGANDTQFMAYYDGEGAMCLAKRQIGSPQWEINRTDYRVDVNDAHNCISMMIDGEGYLHVAWNHHNSPLNYAMGDAPYSIRTAEKQSMTGERENSVTYPAFYRLNDGNLLFFYRDGGSGNGDLIVNRYDTRSRRWTRLHSNLIAGEGERNAYWQACVDPKGTVHLSWVWRLTPDVATNHDMCYARSTDGGVTWTDSKGHAYALPVTARTAETVAKIPQNSELINQTSMTADRDGNPYIATYYREPDATVPQYHIIYLDAGQWRDISTGFRQTPFSLKGAGTKKIPVSRPLLVCTEGNEGKQWRLVFRDAERNDRVSMAVCDDLSGNEWTISDLTDYPVGDWEPTCDTELLKTRNRLYLFVQKSLQYDGERNSKLSSQPIVVLEVPTDSRRNVSRFSYRSKADVLSLIKTVNDRWQETHPAETTSFWHVAAYHTGNMAAYDATGDERYRRYSERWAEHNQWKGATSDKKELWRYRYGETNRHVLFGDWQICFQTYIDLYRLDGGKDETKIARAREVMEYEMSTPNDDYWWWADGLYMVMPVMTKLYQVTGNPSYPEKLYTYFSYAKNLMYDDEEGLFYRDAKYIYPKHKTPDGKKDFWSRGNGWVFAGLAKVLQDLPETDVHRPEYVAVFKRMAAALKEAQQSAGHWTRSLLDPTFAGGYETSGTAFFTYGLLWGMNNGLLDRNEYREAAANGWRYLTEIALQADGDIGYVQPIGERANQHSVNAATTADFGTGAFLLAACEMMKTPIND